MVVPYGDPNEPHYRKNAFDAGEDGLGKNAHSLKKALVSIGKDDGIKGYWKGNLPQKLFTGKDGELPVFERLAAGACAGMTSTFTHEALGQWCVVFMSFGVKEMDLGEDVDAGDGGMDRGIWGQFTPQNNL
ncbi:hypothetical protein GOBAR_AA39134 [Gossypium barbadense]|uniref:Amine oxidase n=1 Tax=Gossypium barbadense TaxID=3634 RepID=A0A2P5VRY1_GOSBA|nr:hypothetical protein GOBAR_AA39134 [Gossypium barbadense]